jgi:hypothetical protein
MWCDSRIESAAAGATGGEGHCAGLSDERVAFDDSRGGEWNLEAAFVFSKITS